MFTTAAPQNLNIGNNVQYVYPVTTHNTIKYDDV